VRVLSVGSTQIAAKAIAAEFEKQTGHKVILTIRPNIDKELAEDASRFDRNLCSRIGLKHLEIVLFYVT
jgi:hypothetical protein